MSDNTPRYTANELRVSISQAVAAAVKRERERCAKICEKLEGEHWAAWKLTAEPEWQGRSNGAGECAAAIRKG